MHPHFALRARWVLPVDSPPIERGVIGITGETISYLGDRLPRDCPVVNLGEVAILPGLVNAHTHLEFSDFEQPIGERGDGFALWIAKVTQSRFDRVGRRDASPSQAIHKGLLESVQSGTTTLGEIATLPVSFNADCARPQVTAFWEVIAMSPARFPEALAKVDEHLVNAGCGEFRPAISPHAPYTVHPDLFEKLIDLAEIKQLPVAFHLAESREEIELLKSGTGALVDYLDGRGFWLRGAIPQDSRPRDYLRAMQRAPHSLVIHGNYLSADEIEFVAARRDRMSIVYCPRTHDYFGHEPYPLEAMLKAGVNVAIGTDSRASNPDLSLLAEMRFVANRFPSLSGARILELGTRNGAKSLGRTDAGTLTIGKAADLTVIPLGPHDLHDPYGCILRSELSANGTMKGGLWLVKPGMQ